MAGAGHGIPNHHKVVWYRYQDEYRTIHSRPSALSGLVQSTNDGRSVERTAYSIFGVFFRGSQGSPMFCESTQSHACTSISIVGYRRSTNTVGPMKLLEDKMINRIRIIYLIYPRPMLLFPQWSSSLLTFIQSLPQSRTRKLGNPGNGCDR